MWVRLSNNYLIQLIDHMHEYLEEKVRYKLTTK